MNPVVVIGAGLAGPSAAYYLTGRAYDVTVVEREQLPGGRASVQHRDGFTLDAGPTVLTIPDPITDALWAASRDPSVNLNELMPMRRLDPAYRACFADRTINVRSGREAMREEIAQTCGSVCAAAAPDGCSTLYVLEPVPSSTARSIGRPKRSLCGTVSMHSSQPEISKRSDHRAAGDPIGLASPGHGGWHPTRARSHLRPDRTLPSFERRAPPARDVFAVSGTVPGVGVPMVLISGKLAGSRGTEYLRESGR